MNDDGSRGVDFRRAGDDLFQGDQLRIRNPRDVEFVRFADVDDLNVVAALDHRVEFLRRDLSLHGSTARGGYRFRLHAAELFVVDERLDGRFVAAEWATR